jgi:CspA family cold shock protein
MFFRDGVGFIAPDDGGAYIYVQLSPLETAAIGDLAEGSRVRFDVAPDARRNRAANVKRL